MIVEHYPAPKPKSTVFNLPWDNSLYARAQRHGLSIPEYNSRVNIVEEALKSLDCNVGDTVYPYNSRLLHKHGKAIIVAICRHYDQYGNVKWSDDMPLLVAAKWEATPNEIFNCTVNYLTTKPDYIKEICS